MSQPAIRVTDLGKQYRIGQSVSYKTIRESMMSLARLPLRLMTGGPNGGVERQDILWALRHLNFEVQPGDVVGIIGRNGAGKSTLLKILSRITEPSEGQYEVYGRVGCLLEVGTGFHPELTGRENIYLNGAILGMSRMEIKSKYDQIVEFAEVDKFLDTPVKRYSSGMRVRLGFSVAAHLQPEILIVDEVLAVGDVAFQKKCLEKMEVVAQSGRTVLFVSHNMAAVENLCRRVIVLEAGQMIADTTVEDGVKTYLQSFSGGDSAGDLSEAPRKSGHSPIIHRLELLNEQGQNVSAVQTNDSCTLRLHYRLREPKPGLVFVAIVENHVGQLLFRLSSRMQHGLWTDTPMAGTAECRIDRLPLLPGSYAVTVVCGTGEQWLDRVQRALQFQVVESDIYGTGMMYKGRRFLFSVDADWRLLQEQTGPQQVW